MGAAPALEFRGEAQNVGAPHHARASGMPPN